MASGHISCNGDSVITGLIKIGPAASQLKSY